MTFAQEQQPSPIDTEVLVSGDTGGGTSFQLEDLAEIFGRHLEVVEVGPVVAAREGSFGADFLNAALLSR